MVKIRGKCFNCQVNQHICGADTCLMQWGGEGTLDTPRPLKGIEQNLLYTGPHESRSIGNTASLGLFAVHKIVSEYTEKIHANDF